MNEKKEEEINITERLKNLSNKIEIQNINTFSMIKRLTNHKSNEIKFRNFSQLKSKIIEKHFNKTRKNLKNKRLNQIFDKEKNCCSSSFIKKFQEVFKETNDINKRKGINYISNRNNKSVNGELNSKLLSCVNKIKKINSKNEINKIYNLNSISNSKDNERKYNSIIMNNFYDTFYHINKTTNYNKIIDLKKENVYKNIQNKTRFNNNYNKGILIKKLNNKYNNLYRNNMKINKLNKIYNSLDYFQSILNTTNRKFENNNLFSIRKNIIDKK